MPIQFRCSGRVFPNGPPQSRVGCLRRSPYGVGVTLRGTLYAPHHVYEGQPIICRWSGNAPSFGLNPRANWNADEGEYPNMDLNVSVQWDGLQNLFRLIIQLQDNSVPVHTELYSPGFEPWIEWEAYNSVTQIPILGAHATPPLISNDYLEMYTAQYSLFPANSCLP